MPILSDSLHIGVDLDNTLLDYSELFHSLAWEQSLIPADLPADKTLIRDCIRRDHGEQAWQHVQALAYGERILEARLFPGVRETLAAWRESGYTVNVISHKTRYTMLYGASGPDLHASAFRFLCQDAITATLIPEHLCFCASREEKCREIQARGCAIFIDDLPEIFSHPLFPRAVIPVLFAPYGGHSAPVARCPDWQHIARHIQAIAHE